MFTSLTNVGVDNHSYS